MYELAIYLTLSQLVVAGLLYMFLRHCYHRAMDEIREAEDQVDAAEDRLAIAVALAKGATEYFYLDIGEMPEDTNDDDMMEMCSSINEVVDGQHHGALFDPDKSDWQSGRLAFLLPKA